jgi:hypothetical protein
MMALLQRFAPKTAQALAERAPAMAPAKLHAQLALGGKLPAGEARLGIDGNLGTVRLALAGDGQVDAKAFRVGDMRLNGKLSADDGKALVTMLGLDPIITVGQGPGELTLNAKGPARGEMRVDGRLTAGGLEASAKGSARVFADNPAATLRVSVARADAAPLRGIGGTREPLPVTFAGRMALSAQDLRLSDVDASVGETTLRGQLAMTLGSLHRVEGEVEADTVAGPGLIAAVIGMPAPADSHGAAWAWAEDPFGDGAFGNFAGKLALKLRRVELMPRLTAREFHATLRLGRNELAFDDMAGVVAGGRLSGTLSFHAGDDGLTAHGKIALAGVEAASLLRAQARPPVTGSLGVSLDVQGAGLSPVALIGSLHGSGTITLNNAELAGLDPRTFDVVTHAVDQGLAVDAARITGVVRKALDSGQLSVRQARGTIAVNAGQMRLRDVTADSADAALALAGDLDLIDGALDAHLVLSGTSQAGGVRPDIYMALKGPLTDPTRSIDVSALTGWLTLRAIENQARRVQELEEAARKRAEAERKRVEAERKRAEAERKRQEEAARMRQEEEARKRAAAALKQSAPPAPPSGTPAAASAPSSATGGTPSGGPSPRAKQQPVRRGKKQPIAVRKNVTKPAPVGPLQLAPVRRSGQAPALPAPIEVGPLPVPAGAPPSEASVGPQN